MKFKAKNMFGQIRKNCNFFSQKQYPILIPIFETHSNLNVSIFEESGIVEYS
eukprot:UN24991